MAVQVKVPFLSFFAEIHVVPILLEIKYSFQILYILNIKQISLDSLFHIKVSLLLEKVSMDYDNEEDNLL